MLVILYDIVIGMKSALQLNITGETTISLPSGAEVILPLCNIVFQKWTGDSPSFDFGKKPLIDYEGEAIFAELAILKLLKESGWDGAWVETYGGIHFLNTMPKDWKLANQNISIPKDKEAMLQKIWGAGKTSACFDVLVWKNDKILFYESKHRGKDRLTNAQTKFIEGALSCGIPKESLIIVEWKFN